MIIEENKDITGFTTFGIPVKTKYFAEYSSEKELLELSRNKIFLENEVFHIGGGSNLLFTSDYAGLILHSCIKGIKRYDKDSEYAYAIVGAGEKWDDFVNWCLAQNLAGVENLAGIPGEVGASPVQNVGAYGVEAKDVIHSVECFDLYTRKVRLFTNAECKFGYRDSFFKHEGRNRYVVLRVSFKLRRDGIPSHLEYGPLRKLKDEYQDRLTISIVANEVKRIRDSKLPDPNKIGSAGSFFKNPVVRRGYLKEVEAVSGVTIPYHDVDDTLVKISAAWLIDNAGLKGLQVGGAKVFESQPLVIVNENNATASDVETLAEDVRKKVREAFLIDLHREVNYISSRIEVTVLGSGTSKGVPEIGCSCKVCRSEDAHDKRLRASILINVQGYNILIDPSPDLRQQCLSNNIVEVDAVLITHTHYDHVGGIDDLRPFCGRGGLPIYLRKDVNDDLHKRLDYCFREVLYPGVPTFHMNVIDNFPFYFNGIEITPIEVMHGKLPIYGYRIGDFAYITDAKTIEEKEIEKLYGLDTLIVNSLRDREHFSHFNLTEALDLISKVKPRRAYLTHFSHEIGKYSDLLERLPENVKPAFDGLRLLSPIFDNEGSTPH